MSKRFRAPLYLGVAMLLSSAAFAQAPDSKGGGQDVQRQMPQVERKAPPPAAAQAPAPSATPAPAAAPTPSTAAPSGRVSGSTTINRDTSTNVTVGRTDGESRFSQTTRSDRFRRGDRWDRSRVVIRDRVRPAFAFISGPRIIVRPGWCRGLHRGWHVAPGVGEHAGTHRGLFRC